MGAGNILENELGITNCKLSRRDKMFIEDEKDYFT